MNKPVDVVISFDTTGSMYPCLTQVRRNVKNLVNRLFRELSDLRIGIIVHGDYCDKDTAYVVKYQDLTRNEEDIVDIIENSEKTCGGDYPECYELVLKTARTEMNWKAGNSKLIVLIGDDVPHPVDYTYGKIKNIIDWRNELKLLVESGIKIFGVHAMPSMRQHSRFFYREIADITNGEYLVLDQFSTISDIILASCYEQSGEESKLDDLVQEVTSKNRMTRGLAKSFETLRKGRKTVGFDTKRKDNLICVFPGRFQLLEVSGDYDKQEIQTFADLQGITFQPGRIFYELTKTEEVQRHKEIILVDKNTGDIFTGPQVRKLLGIPFQLERGEPHSTDKVRLSSKTSLDKGLKNYKVFIQSTSYNRKLVGGTEVLYELV